MDHSSRWPCQEPWWVGECKLNLYIATWWGGPKGLWALETHGYPILGISTGDKSQEIMIARLILRHRKHGPRSVVYVCVCGGVTSLPVLSVEFQQPLVGKVTSLTDCSRQGRAYWVSHNDKCWKMILVGPLFKAPWWVRDKHSQAAVGSFIGRRRGREWWKGKERGEEKRKRQRQKREQERVRKGPACHTRGTAGRRAGMGTACL